MFLLAVERGSLRSALRRRDRPSILSPNYLHLFALARELKGMLRDRGGLTLDLGADEAPYRVFLGQPHTYYRFDLDPACRPDVAADIVRLPIRSDSVDLVICTQVAEFVADPRELASECRRVLRPGGTLVLSAPYFWPNQPTELDNYRFTYQAMRRLCAGFTDVRIRPVGNAWVTLAQVAARCVYQAVGVAGLPAYVVLALLGRVFDLLPEDNSLSTGYVVRAVKPAERPAAREA